MRRTAVVEGHVLSYLDAGPAAGQPIVLLHGLASDSETWDKSIEPLAEHGVRVLAVDLLGHGRSDKPRERYHLDDFARQLHLFLDGLGLGRVTVCGHSLGAAIAVHFGYHYPEHIERLVLVSAGGLGKEVHVALRAAVLPIAPRMVGWALAPRLRRVYGAPWLRRTLRLTPDTVVNLTRVGRALADSAGRDAFFAALRGVVELSGQRGSFLEMRRLADHVPTLVVWSEGDGVIPVAHAHATRAQLPGSRLVLFPGGGHEPHRRHAEGFAEAVAEFMRTTCRGT